MTNCLPALEVITSSGLEVQNPVVKKTLRYKTTVDWGLCVLRISETSSSMRVSLSSGL